MLQLQCLLTLGYLIEPITIYQYENGDDYVREGLFRIIDRNGLFGFANKHGIVVIKPQFFFAFPFEGGKAKVYFKRLF